MIWNADDTSSLLKFLILFYVVILIISNNASCYQIIICDIMNFIIIFPRIPMNNSRDFYYSY